MSYVDKFLKLKCAPDILGVVPRMNNAAKEISEAYAVIRRVRCIALAHPMVYDLVDLCSGNALVPVTAAHLLPTGWNHAVDIKPRAGQWSRALRFSYHEGDVRDPGSFVWHVEPLGVTVAPTIVTAVHPCGDLATHIVSWYLASPWAKRLILMPCCIGPHPIRPVVKQKMGSYLEWALWLAERAGGKLLVDKNVLSPCNAIIEAHK